MVLERVAGLGLVDSSAFVLEFIFGCFEVVGGVASRGGRGEAERG